MTPEEEARLYEEMQAECEHEEIENLANDGEEPFWICLYCGKVFDDEP